MEKRIELESRGKNASEVKELNLDNCRSTSVVGLDDYVNLESLSLINVGLTSLKSFPKLPNLKRLELSDNRISNGLNFLCGSPKLTHLNISGNKISNLETLAPLKGFTKLKNLDLFNNEVTSIDSYRNELFNLIPSLKYLDGFDQEDREGEDSDDDINGNDDSSDLDGSDDLDDDVSLSAVYNDNLDEETSDDQFEVNYEDEEEEEEDDLDDTEDGENIENQSASEESTRGKKRKHEDESETN